MTFSLTGLSYLAAFFPLSLLTYRFFQYQVREKTAVSKAWFYFCFILSLFIFITAVSGLFFSQNPFVLKLTVVISTFLQGLASAVLAYIIIHLRLSQFSPKAGFWLVFILSLGTVIATIVFPFQPFLEEDLSINWDISSIAGVLRAIVFFACWLPAAVIIGEEYKFSDNRQVKDRALGLGMVLFAGFLVGFLDFFLERLLKLGTLSSEISLIATSILLVAILCFGQKPLPSKEAYKPPSYPKIKW